MKSAAVYGRRWLLPIFCWLSLEFLNQLPFETLRLSKTRPSTRPYLTAQALITNRLSDLTGQFKGSPGISPKEGVTGESFPLNGVSRPSLEIKLSRANKARNQVPADPDKLKVPGSEQSSPLVGASSPRLETKQSRASKARTQVPADPGKQLRPVCQNKAPT